VSCPYPLTRASQSSAKNKLEVQIILFSHLSTLLSTPREKCNFLLLFPSRESLTASHTHPSKHLPRTTDNDPSRRADILEATRKNNGDREREREKGHVEKTCTSTAAAAAAAVGWQLPCCPLVFTCCVVNVELQNNARLQLGPSRRISPLGTCIAHVSISIQ
jgi:hypothetical protein